MAHRSSQRRNLAPPEPNPPPAPANHPKPTIFSTSPSHHHYPKPNPDLIHASKSSFLVKPFSSLNLSRNHRKQSQTKHSSSSLVDTLSQTKSMTSSAIVESSKYSLPKPNTTHNTVLAQKDHVKKTHKEKPSLMKNEKKDSIDRCVLVEDVKKKIEKSKHDVVERVSVSLGKSGGRRRSFCGSQVDLGDVFAINGAKMVSADMPPFMQIHAVDCARKAIDSMEKFTSKTLALSLKKEFDGVYGPAWHCIVGTSFGSFVTHSVGGFLYFSMDQKLYILLFKTTVQKAD